MEGQAVGVFEGQFAVHVGAVSHGGGSCRTDAAFVLDPKQPNGNPQSSILSVGAMKGWASPMPSTIFRTASDGHGRRTTPGVIHVGRHRQRIPIEHPTMTMSTGACGVRVNFGQGTIPSHTTCTAYRAIADGPPRASTITYLDRITGTTPPPQPTPCTFVYSAWTACTGTQTRTYTASPFRLHRNTACG